jgi:hypothetical protein
VRELITQFCGGGGGQVERLIQFLSITAMELAKIMLHSLSYVGESAVQALKPTSFRLFLM